MGNPSGWARLRGPLVASAAVAVVSWFAFVAHREVPILDWFDLAVHEAGHLAAAFLPRLAMFMAGSVAQVAFPAAMALYFALRRGDLPAAGFCTAWAGASAWDVSVYARDAVSQSLPLVGGGEHDWAYILGPNGFDALDRTAAVAGFIEFSGAVLAVLGIGLALSAAFPKRRKATIAPVPSTTVHPAEIDPWIAASSLPFHHEG
jgi:hypothetical protein